MPSGAESFYLEVGRKGVAPVPPFEKSRALLLDPEAEEALENLKKTLTSAPVLVPPQPAEPLLLYVASTTHVVSAAVVVERREEGHALPVQRPVYFVSEVFSETKARYPQIQKLIYAVILARRKRSTTSSTILSQYSHPSPWERSSKVEKPREESPNGRLSS